MTGTHLLKHGDSQGSIVVFTAGLSDVGKPFYAYILLRPNKYEEYMKISEEGNFDINNYGRILMSGPGFEPSFVDDPAEHASGIIV